MESSAPEKILRSACKALYSVVITCCMSNYQTKQLNTVHASIPCCANIRQYMGNLYNMLNSTRIFIGS